VGSGQSERSGLVYPSPRFFADVAYFVSKQMRKACETWLTISNPAPTMISVADINISMTGIAQFGSHRSENLYKLTLLKSFSREVKYNFRFSCIFPGHKSIDADRSLLQQIIIVSRNFT
jgi:hypothetical protein